MTEMPVWVLLIEHKHGVNCSVHRTEEGSKAELFSFVADWWQQEMPAGEAMPSSEGEAIQDYFAAVEGRESFTIHESVLQD